MSHQYQSRKVLKIATALYMITDIMSEKEPLKWHLRGCAVSLLEASGHDLKMTIERTIDILAIARIARAVSTMNADVLEEELQAIYASLDHMNDPRDEEALVLKKDFFTQSLPAPENNGDNLSEKKEEKLHNTPLPQTPVTQPFRAQTVPLHPVTPKSFETYKTPVVPKREEHKEEKQPERPATTLIPQGIRSAFVPKFSLLDESLKEQHTKKEDPKNGRRETILSVIREKGTCSIKDISAQLTEVSEKTIQRELAAMTEENILIKEGDRRWSTYRLA